MAQTNGTNGVNGTNGHLPAHITAQEFAQQEFDYLICGGGTAGLCIAARLTENPDITVGVIEAGKNRLDDPLVDVPALFLQMLGNPEYDWMYNTVPQKANNGIVHHIPRGKAVGGSSAINYMMYVRGSIQDYDDWAAISGDPSWDGEHMKHYMRKHQTVEPIPESIKDRTSYPLVGANHGTEGPVRTGFNDNALPIEDKVIKAADEVCGFSKKPTDPWSGDHIGFFNTMGSVARTGPNRGKRSYAGRGFFAANAHRPNLKLIDESTIARVVLDGDVATGVEYITGGQRYSAKAKREVIVSGGVFGSPQILELSGIGDRKILEAAGVQCLVDNPAVGNDFQDHQIVITGHRLVEGEMSNEVIYKPEVMEMAQKALAETQGGPLTNISCVQGFFPVKKFLEPGELEEAIQLIKDTKVNSEFHRKQLDQVIEQIKSDTSANLQFVLIPAGVDPSGVSDQSHIFPPPADPNGPNHISLCICAQYCASRGHIHIKSNDPFEHPEIDPGYISHPADHILLSGAYKFADQLAKNLTKKGIITERVAPAPDKVDFADPKARRDYVKEFVAGEYHVCGSVAMGHALDSKLRVKGVKNLRVADASVFANNVSGNIVSSVYAVAEKAADMIKEDQKATNGVKAH